MTCRARSLTLVDGDDAASAVDCDERASGEPRPRVATTDDTRNAQLPRKRSAVIEWSAGLADQRRATDDEHGKSRRHRACDHDIAGTDVHDRGQRVEPHDAPGDPRS